MLFTIFCGLSVTFLAFSILVTVCRESKLSMKLKLTEKFTQCCSEEIANSTSLYTARRTKYTTLYLISDQLIILPSWFFFSVQGVHLKNSQICCKSCIRLITTPMGVETSFVAERKGSYYFLVGGRGCLPHHPFN